MKEMEVELQTKPVEVTIVSEEPEKKIEKIEVPTIAMNKHLGNCSGNIT